MEHEVEEFIIITIGADLRGDYDYSLNHPGPAIYNIELVKQELLQKALFGGGPDDAPA